MVGNNDLFLVAIDEPSLPRVRLQFVPMSLNDSRKARIKNMGIIGRNNDYHQFTGGEDKLSFSVTMFADDQDQQNVLERFRLLKSFTYASREAPPSRIQIVWGNVFDDGSLWILTDVQSKLMTFQRSVGYAPRHNEVKLSFVRDATQELYADDIRNTLAVGNDQAISSQSQEDTLSLF